ncbi:hypothetical protein JTE90_029313 [Oedothorax gibbosus]|uniref:Uncharacterized protein n=1 Tax=Oedothorax gibbosus TaxID=931172 RepID=A0AAV6TX22_9ARAC|nr:hypothetical protein JTE90_029313 [Oedothorax gibbosus]
MFIRSSGVERADSCLSIVRFIFGSSRSVKVDPETRQRNSIDLLAQCGSGRCTNDRATPRLIPESLDFLGGNSGVSGTPGSNRKSILI